MSLAFFLLAKAISDSVEITRAVASSAQTAAAAAQIASSVSTIKSNNRTRAEANRTQQASANSQVYTYDVDLFLAKVAMLSYIAKADRMISPAERTELEQTLNVAKNMYGREVTDRARNIFDGEKLSFTALESYLRKVHEQDLDSFIFYSEEYAKADNELTSEETDALQKLKAYIDSRKGKKSFSNLTCPGCGGAMHPDSYGYKATCDFCGYEMVLNTDNSPNKIHSMFKCTSCGTSFDNSKPISFCKYCGGRVVGVSEQNNSYSTPNMYQNHNGANLYITYNTINSNVGMVTRIVSDGTKHTYSNGQTFAFRLAPGCQTIILKIGKKNYSRDIVIHPSNSPVRIYASYNGRAQISIDQPSQ